MNSGETMYTSTIGIHYSGAETPTSRLKALAVYRADASGEPKKVVTPDAYAVARRMSEIDRTGRLDAYFHPPLTDEERLIAEEREGWILGTM